MLTVFFPLKTQLLSVLMISKRKIAVGWYNQNLYCWRNFYNFFIIIYITTTGTTHP